MASIRAVTANPPKMFTLASATASRPSHLDDALPAVDADAQQPLAGCPAADDVDQISAVEHRQCPAFVGLDPYLVVFARDPDHAFAQHMDRWT